MEDDKNGQNQDLGQQQERDQQKGNADAVEQYDVSREELKMKIDRIASNDPKLLLQSEYLEQSKSQELGDFYSEIDKQMDFSKVQLESMVLDNNDNQKQPDESILFQSCNVVKENEKKENQESNENDKEQKSLELPIGQENSEEQKVDLEKKTSINNQAYEENKGLDGEVPLKDQEILQTIQVDEKPPENVIMEDVNIEHLSYVNQIKALKSDRLLNELKEEGFTHLRTVIGDGNCYWRCVAYGYLEQLAVNNDLRTLRDLYYWIDNESHYFKIDDQYMVDEDLMKHKMKSILLTGLAKVIKRLEFCGSIEERFSFIQRFYLIELNFDKCFIYLIRTLTKNFILKHSERTLNGLKLCEAPLAEENEDHWTLDGYFEGVVMKMNRDAQGLLLYIVPIVLRINVEIVNIETAQLFDDSTGQTFFIEKCGAKSEDLALAINDSLNLHNKTTLYIIIKDGHYDMLYKQGSSFENLNKLYNSDEFFYSNLRNLRRIQINAMKKCLEKEQEEVKQAKEGGSKKQYGISSYLPGSGSLKKIKNFLNFIFPMQTKVSDTDKQYMTCCRQQVSLKRLFEYNQFKVDDYNALYCSECNSPIMDSQLEQLVSKIKIFEKNNNIQDNHNSDQSKHLSGFGLENNNEQIQPKDAGNSQQYICRKCARSIVDPNQRYRLKECGHDFHLDCLNESLKYSLIRPCTEYYDCMNFDEIDWNTINDVNMKLNIYNSHH